MSRHPRASDDTEGGFLSRWSRRKRRADEPEQAGPVRESGELEQRPDESRMPEADAPFDEASGEAERVKTDEDMPDLASIDETTDMSDFFSPGVSEELRNQALRRLFRMAKFNVTDGLDDYNQDFRNFAPLGDMVTADMRHRMEMDQQRQERADEPDEPAPGEEPAAAAQAGEEAGPDPQEEETAGMEPEREPGQIESPAGESSRDDADVEPETRPKSKT